MDIQIDQHGDWRGHLVEGRGATGMKMLGVVKVDGIEGALAFHWSLDRYLMVTRCGEQQDLKVLPRERVAAMLVVAKAA